MGFLDRVFGEGPAASRGAQAASADQQALARYRYLLRTAPPDTLEQAHAEAFAQLSAEQRAQVLHQLSSQLPASEHAVSTEPAALARMATRAELRRPGVLERSFNGAPGFGSMLLSSVAGTVIGSSIAHALLGGFHQSPEAEATGEDTHAAAWDDDSDADTDDTSGDFDGGDSGDV